MKIICLFFCIIFLLVLWVEGGLHLRGHRTKILRKLKIADFRKAEDDATATLPCQASARREMNATRQMGREQIATSTKYNGSLFLCGQVIKRQPMQVEKGRGTRALNKRAKLENEDLARTAERATRSCSKQRCRTSELNKENIVDRLETN